MTIHHFWSTNDESQSRYPCGAVDYNQEGYREAELVNCKACKMTREWKWWAFFYYTGYLNTDWWVLKQKYFRE